MTQQHRLYRISLAPERVLFIPPTARWMLESPGLGWAGYKNMKNMSYLTQTSVNNNKLSANRQDQEV